MPEFAQAAAQEDSVLKTLYDGGYVKTVDGAEPSITFEGVTGVKNAKIYMWDGMANAKPLYESFEIIK